MKPITVLDYDAKWDKVRKSLDVIGIDADTVMVPHSKTRCLLRDKLERLAQQYRDHASIRTPTVQQVIDATNDDIEKIAMVRNLFAPHAAFVPYLLGDDRVAELYRLLTAAEIDLQKAVKRVYHGSEISVFRYEGKRDNASKPALRDYLLRLAIVWNDLASKASAPRHRNRFVHACAVTVIPDITIKNVRDYLKQKD